MGQGCLRLHDYFIVGKQIDLEELVPDRLEQIHTTKKGQ